MTNFNEVTSESSNETSSVSHDVVVNPFVNLGQTIVDNFKKCTEEIQVDNSEVMTIINQAIGEQREIFRDFIRGSIKSNDRLKDFSYDILSFVDCFKDSQFSNEEILDLLRDLLEKSENNAKSAKELKDSMSRNATREEEISNEPNEPNNENNDDDLSIILENEDIGMKEKLTKIHNYLKVHVDAIKRSPEKIDSIQKSKLRTILNKILQFFKDHPILGIFGSGIFLAFSAAIDVIALITVLLVYLTGTGVVFGNDALMKNERNKLVDKMDQTCDGLRSIVIEIGKIETFWSDQTERIQYLMDNLENFDNNERHRRRLIANNIERRWKNVEVECRDYSRLMNDVLNRDNLERIDN